MTRVKHQVSLADVRNKTNSWNLTTTWCLTFYQCVVTNCTVNKGLSGMYVKWYLLIGRLHSDQIQWTGHRLCRGRSVITRKSGSMYLYISKISGFYISGCLLKYLVGINTETCEHLVLSLVWMQPRRRCKCLAKVGCLNSTKVTLPKGIGLTLHRLKTFPNLMNFMDQRVSLSFLAFYFTSTLL